MLAVNKHRVISWGQAQMSKFRWQCIYRIHFDTGKVIEAAFGLKIPTDAVKRGTQPVGNPAG